MVVSRRFDAIFYVLRGGIAWRLLPNDLPPKSTVFRWFATWRDNGLFEAINHALVMADRERIGREASPTAVVLDSQRQDHGERRPDGLRRRQEGEGAQAPGQGGYGWARADP